MALASKSPTQMGSERFSSSSRRMIIGMLESGSSASPLTFISSHMARLLLDRVASTASGGCRAAPASSPRRLCGSARVTRTGTTAQQVATRGHRS